jgi:hypothetical protein
MRITIREDIAAPAAHVWAQATDAAGFERQALRRGAEVTRLDRHGRLAPGAAWRLGFTWRGRERTGTLTVTRLDVPQAIGGRFESGGLVAETLVEVIALSRGTTRLSLTIELRATGLTARLLVQSLRLVRGKTERRLAERVGAWAREVEGRWQRRRPAG